MVLIATTTIMVAKISNDYDYELVMKCAGFLRQAIRSSGTLRVPGKMNS